MRKAELNALLRVLIESGEGVTDLNFTGGKPPQVERDGELAFPFVDPPLPELSPFMTEQIVLNLLQNRPVLIRRLVQTGSCDFAYTVPGVARFRVNVFSQRGSYSIVLRRLATRIPDMDDLVLPRVFRDMATLDDGLVLITGGPGSGKTTTMASLVHEMNLNRPVHIVTLEDPIEFLHQHQIGTVNQRELGLDFESFADGLRAALRQSPRVIVLGEIRDRESAEMALAAAESGLLVVSTMRTVNPGQTVRRFLDLFPGEEQERVRQRFADCVRYIASQTLLPRVEGGRIVALEILSGSYRAQDIIRLDETEEKTFYRILSEGGNQGMQTLDQHLVRLYDSGLITEETCRHYGSGRVEATHEIERIAKREEAEEEVEEAKEEIALPAEQPAVQHRDLKMDYTWGRRSGER